MVIQTSFALLYSPYYFGAFIQKDGFKLHSSLKVLYHLPSIPSPPPWGYFYLQTRALVQRALSFPAHIITKAQILMEGEKQSLVIRSKWSRYTFLMGRVPFSRWIPSDHWCSRAWDRGCAEKLCIFNTSALSSSTQERLYLCQMPFWHLR